MESKEKQNRPENILSQTESCDPATETKVESSAGNSSSSPTAAQTEVEFPAPADELPADLSEPYKGVAKKGPQWKSRKEYEAYQAFVQEKDPEKRVGLVDAFLATFKDSDFKENAHLAAMQTYQELNDSQGTIDAARQVLQNNPGNIDALFLLSYTFHYNFKADDPDVASKLSRAATDARRGLEALQTMQKPASVSDSQFENYIETRRILFNNTAGFVALQQKVLAEKNEIYYRLLRKQAELENLRKRLAREKEEFSQYLGEKLTRDLLPLLDGFERALTQKIDNVPEEYYRGMELLYRELWEVLRRAGLAPVDAKGKEFDPHLHQAVESMESTEHPDHEVLEEFQKGYKFKQRLLRPSLVKVAIQPVPASSSENPEK